MTTFDKAWAIVKDDDDPECEDCGSKIPSGEQYGCERCGKDICGLCMTDDQYGYPGYRGDMDDDIHPAYDEVMSQSGAHCPECASQIVQEWNDEKEERMEEEAEEEALRQLEAEAQSEFNQKLDEQPFFGDNRGKMLGQDESPHFHSKFHPDWQDLNRSKDSFESAWGIAKAADRKKATWSQEDIDRLNTRNDKVREELKENPLINSLIPSDADHMAAHNSWRATGPKRDVLADALSRARRENAKPKPKMRITRPDDWE